jgi:UDP-N-acetylglucosamine 4,6-dehydratase
VLVSEDEARNALELPDMFVIQPTHGWWRRENWADALPLPEGFRYASETNPHWLSAEELHELIGDSTEKENASLKQRASA